MDATLDNDPGDGWVPLAAAANQLGLSRDALRRRIRRGTIPSRQVQTRYGATYEVQLAEVSATVADAGRQANGHHPGASATVTPASLAEFATLVRDLSERSERNAWQARAEHLSSQLDQAQRALPAPMVDNLEIASGRDSAHATDKPTQQTSEPKQRGWLARWLRWPG